MTGPYDDGGDPDDGGASDGFDAAGDAFGGW